MRAPAFWWREPGLAAALLAPAASLYAAVARQRQRRPASAAPVPVICVGNMTVGGSGKTPTALALAERLAAAGRRPGFLLRGYGGRLPGPVLVDPVRHGFAEIGDEALLLARRAPTVVARDRPAGAALLAGTGIDVVVMDDGMQNPSLRKGLTLAVVDAARGHGNGRTLPAGPLRLPGAEQWRLVHAVVVVGDGAPGEAVAREAGWRGKPVLRARLVPDETGSPTGRRVVAFAGIGRPEKFFDTARASGADLVAAHGFPDHHAYTAAELRRLADEADRFGADLLTTEKDAVRLPSDLAEGGRLRTLPVRMRFDEPERLDALMAEHLL